MCPYIGHPWQSLLAMMTASYSKVCRLVHFTFHHFTGTQEGQEEAAAGWGWILQRLLHVWAEPDPGVQGGKVFILASHALQIWSFLVVWTDVFRGLLSKATFHGAHVTDGFMCHLTLEAMWDSFRDLITLTVCQQKCPQQRDRTVNQIFFRWQQLPLPWVSSVFLPRDPQHSWPPTEMPANSYRTIILIKAGKKNSRLR